MKMFRLPNSSLCTYGMALCLAVSTLFNTALAAGEKKAGSISNPLISIIDDTPLSKGIALCKEGKYEVALEHLQKAAADNPNDALTNLWLGLALEGNKQPYEAMAAWRKCYGTPKWESVADYLKAMSWWRMGNTNDAITYFNEALVNVKDGKAVNFKPAKEAIKQVKEGQPVPPLSQWADLSTLTAPQVEVPTAPVKNKPIKGSNNSPIKTDNKNTTTNTTNNEKKEVETANALPDAMPKAGKWVATISNGYKGDKLTFTVSADGKRVENVAFTGHWRSSSSRTEVLMNLDPPNPFTVSKGNFSAVQRVEKSRMWWEFIGRFTTATSAEGSYRCTFAGGENDTYKLKWTATYVGAK